MKISIHVLRRLFIGVVIILVLLLILESKKIAHLKQRLLDEEIEKTLDRLTRFQNTMLSTDLSSIFSDHIERAVAQKSKEELEKSWNSTLTKYHKAYVFKTSPVNRLRQTKKVKDLALDRSNLSQEKKAQVLKFRAERRKQTLMAKISKIQDEWAKRNFKIKPVTEFDSADYYK